MKNLFRTLLLPVMLLLLYSCTPKEAGVNIAFEKFTLDNGLKVVLHQDHSDPIVALAIQYHVGSGREKPGRTGFAHFFEHMLFQRSENLPRNAFFQRIAKMGGTFNGSTNADGTNYYEAVPRDALEKILWMEADRMGYFINTVTQSGLEREIDIVSNEKRQNYDSQPYGQSSIIISKELYPQGHPYSWTTIGEIEDLRNATIDDVKEFYHKYYVPNNATLVLTGDFDAKLAKELINKYFAEIPAGNTVEKPQPAPAVLENTKNVMWEDAYAKLPQITITYPTVEQYHKDSYALSAFASLFAGSKTSPLYKVIVEEKKLAPMVNAFSMSREIAGQAQISVRAFDGVNLNDVYTAIDEAFAKFESEGVNEQELQKIKVMQEVNLYNRLSSVMGKALMMARDYEFGGSPVKSLEELDMFMKVTPEDVKAVYEKYFKGQNHLVLSVVPQGQTALAVADSRMGEVTIEKVEDQQMKSQGGKIVDDEYERTPSAIDRSVEPDYLPNTPSITIPAIWKSKLANGMEVYGITQSEMPVIQFTISLKGGSLLDPQGKKGLAYLNARLMNEGTALKSAEELESAMGLLGARITISSDIEGMEINGTALSKNFKEVIALTEEMILKPRFDEQAFARVKQEAKSALRQASADPRSIARKTRDRLLYGEDGTFAVSHLGTPESIDNITIDDVKAFYAASFSPAIATMNIAGAIDLKKCEVALASLAKNWTPFDVVVPEPVQGMPAKTGQIYFVDNVGSPQSMIYVSKPAMDYGNVDFYPWFVTNYRLGSGSQGMLFDVLRLQRGFTYGASSTFETGKFYNNFTASSSVQATTTAEAVAIFNDLIGNYKSTFNEDMLADTKNSLTRAMASSFETLGALVRVLYNVSQYNMPFDYVKNQEKMLNEMTLEQAVEVITKNFNTNEMVFIVVGDARTQLKPLEKLGLGKPILVKL
ncbi:MAG: peptidase M16 [Bacteroidetes bacterium GWE2_39_28]|nr:MAG: peptidase M16 [Bacteroidetes bacterium GWE2_39_28]OFY12174.1 MAG: peptidase M16 [Bacteroidetes bacterium GWF2_39_10]OFZ06814.1 MAG: peptidase M16 [Bacteroidetes bacterium RIFOXYB2_FULL_39_7]HCT94204.1 insulinase family protein [Rikenellaceae bacterium]